MGEPTEPLGEVERCGQAWAPRLEVSVPQPPVPGSLVEKAKRDDERHEGMRAARVPPVDDPKAVAVDEGVLVVQVVVLDRRRQGVAGQLVAQVGEPRRMRAETLDLRRMAR